jgi:hypothetical protein
MPAFQTELHLGLMEASGAPLNVILNSVAGLAASSSVFQYPPGSAIL